MGKHMGITKEFNLEREIMKQEARDTLWSCNMSRDIEVDNSRISNDEMWNDEDWRVYVGEFK